MCQEVHLLSYKVMYIISIVYNRVLREQWIRAKYQRKEFCEGAAKPSYLTGEIVEIEHLYVFVSPLTRELLELFP